MQEKTSLAVAEKRGNYTVSVIFNKCAEIADLAPNLAPSELLILRRITKVTKSYESYTDLRKLRTQVT